MEGSEMQDDETPQDPGLDEAPTGVPPAEGDDADEGQPSEDGPAEADVAEEAEEATGDED